MNEIERRDGWRLHLEALVAAGEMARATARTYDVGQRRYMVWCQETGTVPVMSGSVRAWIAALREQGLSPSSINVWLSGVRHFMQWQVEQGHLPADPTSGIKRTKRTSTRRHKRDVLTNDEMRRLFDAPDVETTVGLRDRAILHLLGYQALRLIEIRRADLVHLRTAQNRLVLDIHGKGRDEADDFVVLVRQNVVDTVYDWLAVRGQEPGPLFYSLSNRSHGQRLSVRSLQQIVAGYFEQIGVLGERKTAHSLRHTAITNAMANGAPPRKVQSWARHASIETTMIYAHEIERLERPAEGFVSYDE